MGMPPTVTRVDRTGQVTYTSSVDRARYTIKELCRGALRDCAKMLRKKMIVKLKKLPGMGKSRRVFKSCQFWVRRIEADLQIGHKADTWYGARGEIGTHNQPARNIIRDTVFENISEIRNIQAKYLSAIEDEQNALRLIDEDEAVSREGDEQ